MRKVTILNRTNAKAAHTATETKAFASVLRVPSGRYNRTKVAVARLLPGNEISKINSPMLPLTVFFTGKLEQQ